MVSQPFLKPLSSAIFKLLFVEVKKKGNKSNGTSESDLVKLGKVVLNKLIFQGVDNSQIVSILVEDANATVYKMDMRFNGQYRMNEINCC